MRWRAHSPRGEISSLFLLPTFPASCITAEVVRAVTHLCWDGEERREGIDRTVAYCIIGRVERPRVLFVCVHNSARSQMSAGLLRSLPGARVVVRNAVCEAGPRPPESHS